MKKTLFVALLFTAALCCAFAQSGIIRELSGEVELKPAGSSAFAAAKIGDTVAVDTVVSTGFRSTAVIEVGSSIIAVRPLTRLTLAEIKSASGTETLNVNLQAGRVKVDVKPPAGTRADCTIQSPSATASVRGTSFEFDTRNLTVSEGTVAFHGSSGMATMVPAGEASYVNEEGRAVDHIETAAATFTPPPPVGTNTGSSAGTPKLAPVTGDLGLTIRW